MNEKIEVKFDFQVAPFDGLLLELLGLPESLIPTHFNVGEDEPRVPAPEGASRLFDIEVVKGRLPSAKNFLELNQELSKW